MVNHSFLTTVTAILILGVATSAVADDGKRYPGASCQAMYGSDAQDLDNFGGKTRNNSSRTIGVICPIIKDNYWNANGTKSASVVGYLYNTATNSSTDFRCWLYSKHASIYGGWVSFGSSPNRGFSTLNLNVNTTTSPGYYHLQCQLPPSSILVGYSVVEY